MAKQRRPTARAAASKSAAKRRATPKTSKRQVTPRAAKRRTTPKTSKRQATPRAATRRTTPKSTARRKPAAGTRRAPRAPVVKIRQAYAKAVALYEKGLKALQRKHYDVLGTPQPPRRRQPRRYPADGSRLRDAPVG